MKPSSQFSSMKRHLTPALLTVSLLLSVLPAHAQPASPLHLQLDPSAPGKAISPDLFGIFFEDLNYAADGSILMVAGAGVFVLGAVNGMIRKDPADVWYTTTSYITGGALLVGGWLLRKAGKPQRKRRNHKLEK